MSVASVLDVLELLTDTPAGTVLTVNVPDRPVEALSSPALWQWLASAVQRIA